MSCKLCNRNKKQLIIQKYSIYFRLKCPLLPQPRRLNLLQYTNIILSNSSKLQKQGDGIDSDCGDGRDGGDG